MSEIEGIDEFRLTLRVERCLYDGHLTQVVFLDGQWLFLKEHVSIDLEEVLENLFEGQVTVSPEQLKVEIAFSHFSDWDDGALVNILHTKAADLLAIILV
jgi:hypothetical protein